MKKGDFEKNEKKPAINSSSMFNTLPRSGKLRANENDKCVSVFVAYTDKIIELKIPEQEIKEMSLMMLSVLISDDLRLSLDLDLYTAAVSRDDSSDSDEHDSDIALIDSGEELSFTQSDKKLGSSSDESSDDEDSSYDSSDEDDSSSDDEYSSPREKSYLSLQ